MWSLSKPVAMDVSDEEAKTEEGGNEQWRQWEPSQEKNQG